MTNNFSINKQNALAVAKALANESRLEILTQLYIKPLTFKNLKEISGLEKSALSNNLLKLLDIGLIEKHQHGFYKITKDGTKLLETLAEFIKESNCRKRETQIANAQRQMVHSFLERHTHKSER
ncbi:MAG: winged helix-turn-helix transcriptional regulator [Crenarchaeota archaeon]|nr:winged helix-turn-helix transcriptional regulator [Thermoproteota archaeon]